ncbi:MAG: hypothetical protein WAO98_09465 [Alphaproteobacteria bacterium]
MSLFAVFIDQAGQWKALDISAQWDGCKANCTDIHESTKSSRIDVPGDWCFIEAPDEWLAVEKASASPLGKSPEHLESNRSLKRRYFIPTAGFYGLQS